ncbi:MAG: lysoplasmalogenase [Clostridiales bacterium]|nr:lysoplasmalogenase [Clostridiales bacterium]
MKLLAIALFLLTALVNIYNNKRVQSNNNHLLTLISKPLLIPLLMINYILNVSTIHYFVIIALTFGWLGDCVIIFHHELNHQKTTKNMIPLLTGLGFFLCGHLTYISLFLKDIESPNGFIFLCLIFYLISGLVVYLYLLKNGLLSKSSPKISHRTKKILKIAIAVYMSVIMTFSFTALLRWTSLSDTGTFVTLLGTLSFLISDTTLSLKEFGELDFLPEQLVMITYISAQSLIVISLL